MVFLKGKIYVNKDSVIIISEGEFFFNGVIIRIFKFDKLEVGEWKIKMMVK